MPVTKTARRALRVSKRKKIVNTIIRTNLDASIRLAKKESTLKTVKRVISLSDRAAKKKVIGKNKAARIKSRISKLLSVKKQSSK
jgi:ribosomal protein S20